MKGEVVEEDVIILEGDDVDDEGVGRDAQQGGEVHPSEGTDTFLAAAAPTLEVQHTMRHAVQVSQGRALPSKTTIIAPIPALLTPPPQQAPSLPDPGSSGALTLGMRQAVAAACEKVRGGAGPLHCSPHCSNSAHPPDSLAPGPSPGTGPSTSPGCRNRCGPSCHQAPLAPAEAPFPGASALKGSQVAP